MVNEMYKMTDEIVEQEINIFRCLQQGKIPVFTLC